MAALSRLPVGSSASTSERISDQGPGDRHPLPLAAGQRRRQEPRHGRRGRPCPEGRRPAAGGARRAACQQRGQLDVLGGGELVHQVEGLEHEADQVAAQPGQRPFSELVDPLPGQRDLARPWAGPARRAGAAASTSRIRSVPSPRPSRRRRRPGQPRRPRGPGSPPGRIPCEPRGRAAAAVRPVSFIVRSFRPDQFRSHASSQRRSAWRRSTMPSSSSAASEPSGSAIAARCASRRRCSSSRRCASMIASGSASLAAAAAISLR